MKRFLLILLLPLLSFSQSKLYLDENMNEISKEIFKNKCKSHMVKCLEYQTDSVTINKVLYKYVFGKISSNSYKQIKSLLESQSGENIQDDASIILKYSDTIKSVETLKVNFDKHVLVCPAPHQKKDLAKIQKERVEWVKAKKKCFNKFQKKNNLSINYIYKHAEKSSTPSSYVDFKWIKDRGIFKNLFFKIMYSKNFVILKPDGEYFLSGSHFEDKQVTKLIENRDWTQFKEDWKTSTTKSLKSGKGFFKAKNGFHKKHCF